MAGYDIKDKYASWKDYYSEANKVEEGGFHRLAGEDLSHFDDLPVSYAERPNALISILLGAYHAPFFLVPLGHGELACLHQCFAFKEEGIPDAAIGIYGSRRSSPFKSIWLKGATQKFMESRQTRAPYSSKDDEWDPTTATS